MLNPSPFRNLSELHLSGAEVSRDLWQISAVNTEFKPNNAGIIRTGMSAPQGLWNSGPHSLLSPFSKQGKLLNQGAPYLWCLCASSGAIKNTPKIKKCSGVRPEIVLQYPGDSALLRCCWLMG